MSIKKITNLNEELDITLFIYIARKNLIWVLFFLTVSIVLANLYLRYNAPVFESTSTIKLGTEDKATKILSIGKNFGENNYNQIAGEIELIRSKIIIEKALSKLPLDISYYAQGTVLNHELYKVSPFIVKAIISDSAIIGTPINIEFTGNNKYQISLTYNESSFSQEFILNKWIKTPFAELKVNVEDPDAVKFQQENFTKGAYHFIINDRNNLFQTYNQSVSVQLLNEQAQTILIKFQDKNSRKAADITNAIAEVFIQYNFEKKAEGIEKTLVFIEEQLNNVNKQLRYSESLIEAFKTGNKILNPEALAGSVLSEIKELKQQKVSLELEEVVLSKLENNLEANKDLGNFISVISGNYSDTYLASVIKSIATLQEEMESQIIQGGTLNNQSVKILNAKITSQKRLLLESILNVRKILKEKKNNVAAKIDLFESNFDKLPAKEAEYVRLERLFSINEKFYSLLLEKKAEFSITIAGLVTTNVILDAAVAASTPISPNRKLVLGSYLLIGILISFAIIIIRYLLHNEITNIDDIKKYTNASVLGFIPKYKEEIPVSQLLIDKNPKSLISEAFRSIRTNLQFISNESGAKIIAISSTISGEGKTFVAINLAGVIAFSGKKVILLDLDMRKPKIHLGFNVENLKGMSTILIDKDKPEDCIHKSALSNLEYITAGPIPPNPSELIISDKMQQLIKYLKTIYDIIVIDTPPVGIVTDGVPVIQNSDYPIYIIRSGFSKKVFIQNINKLIDESKVSKLSVVLNGMESTKAKYGYGYGNNYGYGYGSYGYGGYGYGYYEEDAKVKTSFLKSLFSKNK